MKVVALDIGDTWTGSAISDALGMFARPYQTTATTELHSFLARLFAQEQIAIAVVGYPKTMSGGKSQQTEKVEQVYRQLATLFPELEWILWDERLSSKRADALKKSNTKEDKLFSHSRAAAFILSSYLEFRYQQKA
jgi:putative Holliday junction resolvase